MLPTLQKATVLSGPSGVGKGTILGEVRRQCPWLTWSVSATTRKRRAGERHGIDYFFLTVAQFKQWVDEGRMLEWAKFGDNYYGTPVPEPSVDHLLVENDVQGAPKIREAFQGSTLLIWLGPPGTNIAEQLAVLERRLQNRATEGPDKIRRRLEIARNELELAPSIYDLFVTNYDRHWLDAAREVISAIEQQ